jgi:hypothetical protein
MNRDMLSRRFDQHAARLDAAGVGRMDRGRGQPQVRVLAARLPTFKAPAPMVSRTEVELED